MRRQTSIAIACLLAFVTVTLLLAALEGFEKLPLVSPSQLPGVDVGERVVLEGWVSSEGVRDLGGCSAFEVTDPQGGQARVFVPSSLGEVGPGDEVRVTGVVSLYRGELEVKAGSGGDVRVLSEGTRRCTDLGKAVTRPWEFGGQELDVEVILVGSPVAGDGGQWALVSDAEAPGSVTVALHAPSGIDLSWIAEGSTVRLLASLGYSASCGLVYLEASAVTAV